MNDTFELFSGDPVAAPVPPLVPRTPDPERVTYVMTPAGLNRWTYKGVLVMYDMAKHVVPGRGRWSTVESIGKPEIRGESHVDICKAIDARLLEEAACAI